MRALSLEISLFFMEQLQISCFSGFQLPPSKNGLGSSAVFVDGGNVFNPYVVSEIACGYGLNPKDVLKRIYVSRAFTAYQLSSLVLEKLENAVRKFRSKLVAVSYVFSLFLDRDVPKNEAQDVFMKACGRLEEIARERKVIVVASHAVGTRSSRRLLFLETVLYGRANVVLGLKQSRGVTKLSLESRAFLLRLWMTSMTITVLTSNCSRSITPPPLFSP